MHSLIDPSFFLTNSTGAPHGDTLFSINFNSISSSSWTLSSTSSAGDIRYDGIAMGVAPGIKSMVNSVSRTGGSPDSFSGTHPESLSLQVGIALLPYRFHLPICLQSLG